jgi:outer membrane protein assembly factor BamB
MPNVSASTSLQPIMLLLATLTVLPPAATAGDWPQVLGPVRTGIAAADERLADRWPETGPPVIWKRPVGSGYAGVAVATGRVFLFHRQGDREVTEALDAATGKTLWQADHATRFQPQVGGGDGPLCVPNVSGDRLITFGAQGVLTCLDTATGQIHWQRQTHREFDAAEGYFGAGSSPLVIGDCVVVNVGGRSGAGVVGFELSTGKVRWQTTDEPASYAAPTVIEQGGRQQAVVITRYQCLLIDPTNGAIGWQFPFGMRGPTVNAATPLAWTAADGTSRLLVTAAYGIGSICATFNADSATPIWQGTESLASQYCTPIMLDGHLYCIDGRDDVPPATLKCVDAATGQLRWQEPNFGYGTLLAADGKLLAVKTSGDLMLLKVSPAGFEALATDRPLPGTLRALPALAAGRLYLRDDDTLAAFDIGRLRKR